MAIVDDDQRTQPPFSLWVTGGVSPSAVFGLLEDGRTSTASPCLASGLTAPVTQPTPLLGQAPSLVSLPRKNHFAELALGLHQIGS